MPAKVPQRGNDKKKGRTLKEKRAEKKSKKSGKTDLTGH